MKRVEHFELLNSTIEKTNLIEASAGTGKTYTITGLFLRLVLEKGLPVNEILVLTFTEAATEELRERIRSKLREAVEAFSRGRSEDAFLEGLVKKHRESKGVLRYLGEALRAFDQAAIFTIHGFCRRMLHDNAFESGSLFDTELVVEEENLKREIVEDFWRRHICGESPLFVNYAMNNGLSPGNLISLLAGRVAQPYLKIIPQVEVPDSFLEEKEFRACFEGVRKGWPSAKDEVADILTGDEGLNRTRYGRAKIPLWIQGMDEYVSSGDNNPGLSKGFEKFTSSELEKAVKKNHAPPAHPFFSLCERLKEKQGEMERVFEQRLLGLKAGLFPYAEEELASRKGERNIQSFDDLLLRLLGALEVKGGEGLARAIRVKFRAALIDEFQDTDPVQYAIFRKVFGTEKSTLFLIGDPKQAIYGFRGADIFAYMDAAADVANRYTLGANWRSDPDLVRAINALFTGANRPFVYKEIPFEPTAPASEKEVEPLIVDGQAEPPLELWFLDAGNATTNAKVMTKTEARELIPGSVAGEISRLVGLGRKRRAVIGKRPLREGDITVLVRRNTEARLMQRALSAIHVPSVLYSTGNLFDSHEAMEMERVLVAIAEPNSERLLKGALATDMMGLRGEDLDALMKDETGWESWLVKFKVYHEMWNEQGFMRMFRYLLLEEKVQTRLTSFPDGERRNTNLLHLSEVLHQRSVERKLPMAGLLKWLSEQRDPGSPRLEEHQLRLESDENAVKLVTIHKSKGLEYPVVFCPFTWDGSRMKDSKDPFTFHDERDNMRLILDLGSPEMNENRRSAEKELLAENLRLLYVSLTRARSRCYLIWGRIREAETSAPAYLLHQPKTGDLQDELKATEERFRGLTDEAVLSELEALVYRAGGTVRLSEMPPEAGELYLPLPGEKVALACRKFSGHIDRQWSVSSFSSLVSGQPHGAELADRDPISLPDPLDQMGLEEPSAEEEPSDIFAFPKGTKAGTFFHDIFEHLDFTQDDASPMENLVADKLREYGFEPAWQETISHIIRKVLAAPLDPGIKDFQLSSIRNQDRLKELEFYFPLKPISPEKLKGLFAEHAGPEPFGDFPERIEKLGFSPVKGFMKGFMDMVFRFQGRFYLVDWKSNFLGSRVEDYGREALAAAMEREFYVLQYHIYTVALNQYLHLRLPGYGYETHFGGIFYIFLRGVDPERGRDFGIYRARPPGKLVEELCANLIA